MLWLINTHIRNTNASGWEASFGLDATYEFIYGSFVLMLTIRRIDGALKISNSLYWREDAASNINSRISRCLSNLNNWNLFSPTRLIEHEEARVVGSGSRVSRRKCHAYVIHNGAINNETYPQFHWDLCDIEHVNLYKCSENSNICSYFFSPPASADIWRCFQFLNSCSVCVISL